MPHDQQNNRPRSLVDIVRADERIPPLDGWRLSFRVVHFTEEIDKTTVLTHSVPVLVLKRGATRRRHPLTRRSRDRWVLSNN